MGGEALFGAIRGGLIVSCQALEGEPLYDAARSVMPLMARAAKRAGAVAIRTSSVRDVIGCREETGLPVIGLIKRQYPGMAPFITPTMLEVDQLVEAGADIIALDATARPHEGGETAGAFLSRIRARHPGILLMADVATFAEGERAALHGADCVGTTLSGYTEDSQGLVGPDFALVERLAAALPCPVIAEGRIQAPAQAAEMLRLGAHAVVVGGAITRPLEIAARFQQAILEARA